MIFVLLIVVLHVVSRRRSSSSSEGRVGGTVSRSSMTSRGLLLPGTTGGHELTNPTAIMALGRGAVTAVGYVHRPFGLSLAKLTHICKQGTFCPTVHYTDTSYCFRCLEHVPWQASRFCRALPLKTFGIVLDTMQDSEICCLFTESFWSYCVYQLSTCIIVAF